MIAFCGLKCDECPAFIATQAENEALLERVLREWRAAYNVPELSMEDILCDGCQILDGRLNGYCGQCPIRACGISRGIPNCAHCEDYACEVLERLLSICERQTDFFAYANQARITLDGIKTMLQYEAEYRAQLGELRSQSERAQR